MIEGTQNDTMILQQQQHHHLHHHREREPPPQSQPSPSPSFSSYSSETLADIAARVISELRLTAGDSRNDDDDSLFQPWEEAEEEEEAEEDHQNDDDFEFAFVSRDQNASPVSADDIFCNGQIKPMYMYQVFNAPYGNDAVPSVSQIPNHSIHEHRHSGEETETIRRRLPLRKLMFEERETGSFSSSEGNGEESLEGVAAAEGTYCVWKPNAVVARDRRKSNSTGSGLSSKRWKLRELLLRSLSDGKGKKIGDSVSNGADDADKKRGIVFGVPSKRNSRVGAVKPGSGGGASAERVGKKSVLPYKQELVGLLLNVNGLGRNLNPFGNGTHN